MFTNLLTYRSTTAGASELQANSDTSASVINNRLKNRQDEIPPSRIEDLVVMETDFASGNVTLAWTAPGDNYDEGRASIYQINWRRNVTEASRRGDWRRRRRMSSEVILKLNLP